MQADDNIMIIPCPGYENFDRMEDDFPELRRVVKQTFRDFVARWTTPLPPSPKLTNAATVLRETPKSLNGGVSATTLTPGSPPPSREETEVATVVRDMHKRPNSGVVASALAPGSPPPSPELTGPDAAVVLCELRIISLNGGVLATPPTSGSSRNVPFNALGLIIPKGKRYILPDPPSNLGLRLWF